MGSVAPETEHVETVRLTGVEETLLFTLAMRALDARSSRPVLGDPWAVEVLDRIAGYHRLKVRLLATGYRHLMVLRARRLDAWAQDFLTEHPDATVLSLGCGLDSRAFRLDVPDTVQWYDIDYPDVVALRRRLYPQRDNLHLIGSSVTEPGWLDEVPVTGGPVLVVAEGLLMYLTGDDVRCLLARITHRFDHGELVFDVIGLSQRLTDLSPYRMWACPDPHELERANPRLTLLEQAPVLADYRRISSPVPRVLFGLVSLVPQLRNDICPLRYRFGPPEE
jgi:O-methyltransferase